MDDGPTRREVRETFESIASHFSKTRRYAWPEVEDFVTGRRATLALDLGCGNGRHAELLATVADRVVGVDASRGLLDAARRRLSEDSPTVELIQGDAATVPLRSGAVDLAVYVATIHHLPTRDDRLASLRELSRVLAPDGRALVSAWSTAHDRFDANADADDGFDTTVDWTRENGETVDRFYHIYSPAEFERDLDAAGLDVVSHELSSGNSYAIVTLE